MRYSVNLRVGDGASACMSFHPPILWAFTFFFQKTSFFFKLLEYCDYTGILLNTGRFDIVSNEYI